MRALPLGRTAILVSILGAAFALLVACSGDEDGAGDIADVDAQDVLDRSADRMEQLESFHFEVEHENGATQIIGGIAMEHAEGDVEGREAMQLEVEASFAGANIKTGIIVLPEGAYLQNPLTGRWQQQDAIDISRLFDPRTGVTGLMREATNVEVVDREAIDGVDSYVLEGTVDSGSLTSFVGTAEAGTPVTGRLWVGVEDLLVRRIEVVGPIAPEDGDDIVRRITLSAFDEPVNISVPN